MREHRYRSIGPWQESHGDEQDFVSVDYDEDQAYEEARDRCMGREEDSWREDYIGIREIRGHLCGLAPFIYTWAVVHGIDASGYRGRFCFDSLSYAVGWLAEWDGSTVPEVGKDGCTAIKGSPWEI